MQLAKHAGMAVMEFLKRDIKPRDIVNEKSLRNALACDMALGCSTNTVLHLLAIAHEAGVAFDLSSVQPKVSAQVPNLCHLAPAGPTHMQDLYAAGGIARRAGRTRQGRLPRHQPHHCHGQDRCGEHQGRGHQGYRRGSSSFQSL